MSDRNFLERTAHFGLPLVAGVVAYVMGGTWGIIVLFVVVGWAVCVSITVESTEQRKRTKIALLVYAAMFAIATSLALPIVISLPHL